MTGNRSTPAGSPGRRGETPAYKAPPEKAMAGEQPSRYVANSRADPSGLSWATALEFGRQVGLPRNGLRKASPPAVAIDR